MKPLLSSVLLVVIGLVWTIPMPLHATGPGIALRLTPEETSLAPGEAEDVLVVIDNGGQQPIDQLRLTALGGGDVQARPDAGSVERIDKGGSAVWRIALQRRPEGNRLSDVHVLLEYRRQESPAGAAVTGAATATIKVKDRPPDSAGSVASVKVESALGVLEDRREGGLVFLVVENTSSYPVEVREVRIFPPYFVDVSVAPSPAAVGEDPAPSGKPPTGSPAFDLPVLVPPGHSRALPYRVMARSAVEPGDHSVLWELALSWTRAGTRQQGTLVAKHAFKVKVLGESELLNAVKVPSLLMLPGVLMLLTWSFLRRRLYPRTGAELDVTKADFWLIAVFLSILAAYTYPKLTQRLGAPRDYLVRYGLEDIFNIWLGSMVAGVALYLLWVGGGSLIQRGIAEVRKLLDRRVVPAAGDPPAVVLRKLARAGKSIVLPQVELDLAGQRQVAFLLYETGGKWWIAPPITVELSADAELEEGLDRRLEEGDADRLADFLDRPDVAAAWKVVGELGGPREIAVEGVAVDRSLSSRRIVESGG